MHANNQGFDNDVGANNSAGRGEKRCRYESIRSDVNEQIEKVEYEIELLGNSNLFGYGISWIMAVRQYGVLG